MATVPELQQTDRFLAEADDFRTMARLHGLATGAPECLAALPLRLAQDSRLRSSFTDLLREAQRRDPEFSLPDALSVLILAIGGPTASSTREQALDEATDLTAGFLASLGGWPGPPEDPITDLDNPSPEDPRLAHLYNPSAAAADSDSATLSDPAAGAPPSVNEEELTQPDPLPAITLAEITQALARLERGSVDLRLHLDSIDQRLSRMEPLLEASPTALATGTHPSHASAPYEPTTPAATPSPSTSHPETPRDLVHRADRPPAIAPTPAPARDVAPAPAQDPPPRPQTPRRDRFAAAMELPGTRDSLHFPGRDEAFGLTAAELPPAAIDLALPVEPPIPSAHTTPEPLPQPAPIPAPSVPQIRQSAPPPITPPPTPAVPGRPSAPATPSANGTQKPSATPAAAPPETRKPIASVAAAALAIADPAIAPPTPPAPAPRQAPPAPPAPAQPAEPKTAPAPSAAAAPVAPAAPKPAPQPIADEAPTAPIAAPSSSSRKEPQSRANFTFGGTINTAAAAESDSRGADAEPAPRSSRGPLYLFLIAAVLIAVAAFLLLRGKPLPFLFDAPRPTSASPATPSQGNAETSALSGADGQDPASSAANAHPPTPTSGSSATRNGAAGRVLGARQAMEPVEHEQVFATPTFVPEAVMKSRLESAPAPLYPRIANAANLEGTVVFEAIITKDGAVDGLTVLAGQRLLRDAAANAVRQWRFQPFLLHGQPVQVRTILHTHVAPTSSDGQPQQ